jgi:Tol biopolymer transport system component
MRVIYRFFLVLLFPTLLIAASFNAYGLKFYTVESDHFQIHYMNGCGHMAKEVACKFEELYLIYKNTYGLTLPNKTNVVLIDSDESNGWAFANMNTITLWTHDFDYNMRGSHEWFNDVIAHEYAHIVSIYSSLKTIPQIPEIRFGFFSHPNEKNRQEIIHSFPTEALPPWFTEGIAQIESERHGDDSWDTHRDMILRTLTLSDKLLTWDHMQAFSGRGDDFEKTYNHGFSLTKYISETYGHDKIPALLRASSKVTRLTFDRSIKEVLGISGKKLYSDWKIFLENKYKQQITAIGTQVYGVKINKDGYENYWPKFSPDGKSVFFLSNGKADYGKRNLYVVSLSDTVKESDKIKLIKPISSIFDIDPKSGRMCFTSAKSKKSVLAPNRGGEPIKDLFTDTLPSENPKNSLFKKKTERQVTIKQDIFSASFSPDGTKLACAQRVFDKFRLIVMDTSGKKTKVLYPFKTNENDVGFIYSVDWAPDGHQIAFSFFDNNDRKIAIYDTLTNSCQVVCNTEKDERDPAFSPDGKYLYFSSDRTGIFNIYRLERSTGLLEQVTNVSGGAFAPSIAPDNKQLVYTGYEKAGYSIFLIKEIRPVQKFETKVSVYDKLFSPLATCSITLSTPKAYLRAPRQLMLVPLLLAEQSVTEINNANSGIGNFKTGLVFNLFEPLTLSGLGSEIGGYFLAESKYLTRIIDLNKGGLNPDANFDIGLFGVTNLTPFTLAIDYSLRGIAGKDYFYNETEEEEQALTYNVQLNNWRLQMSHYFQGSGSDYGRMRNELALHLFTDYNLNDVILDLGTIHFRYNLNKGFRVGVMGTAGGVAPSSRSAISPEGFVAKAQYNINNEYSLNEENSFEQNSNLLKENYDTYLFHEFKGHLKMGYPTPWYKHHTLHLDLNGNAIKILKQDKELPSFYLPGAWVPGYSYYYQDIKNKPRNENDTAKIRYDTLVVTGNNVISGELSYRFPLWPGLIDKKIWFIYLEYLYAGVNLAAGGGFKNSSQITEFNRNDWIMSAGCEFRLQAQTFAGYPLALKLRWDNGLDKKAPIGGNRFSISIGYSFDNWGAILLPDYKTPGRRTR